VFEGGGTASDQAETARGRRRRARGRVKWVEIRLAVPGRAWAPCDRTGGWISFLSLSRVHSRASTRRPTPTRTAR
jgi:hypothetical protein